MTPPACSDTVLVIYRRIAGAPEQPLDNESDEKSGKDVETSLNCTPIAPDAHDDRHAMLLFSKKKRAWPDLIAVLIQRR